jgi:glycosyltransferase involved in cell wall biosynthesis
VHIHLCRDFTTMPLAVALRILRLPYIIQTHGMIQPNSQFLIYDAVLTRPAVKAAKQRLVLTKEDLAGLESVARRSLSARQINNAISMAETSHGERDDSAGLEVLFLARLNNRKNPLQFVAMAENLLASGASARFTLVGPDGGLLQQVRGAVSTSTFSSHISYEGAIPSASVPARMVRSDIYVLPSANEPFPMSVLEALSTRTPVVISRTCHISDDLREADAAAIYDGSEQDLIAVVGRLLQDPRRREQLAQNGERFVRSRLSVEVLAEQILQEYKGSVRRIPS